MSEVTITPGQRLRLSLLARRWSFDDEFAGGEFAGGEVGFHDLDDVAFYGRDESEGCWDTSPKDEGRDRS
jgi:hypothetical protein